MINVVIRDANQLYRYGLHYFLKELFAEYFSSGVNFFSEPSEENLIHADIVVLSLCPGEHLTCFPELHRRTKGIIIGLVEHHAPEPDALPICIEEIMFLPRQTALAQMRSLIVKAWSKRRVNVCAEPAKACFNCLHRQLTPQQIRIMAGLYRGKSAEVVASESGVSFKTVYAHKYLTLNKFGLRGDAELLLLLTRLAGKKMRPNFFRDYLNQTQARERACLPELSILPRRED